MNYRFVIFLMATAFLEQTTVSVVRITTTYRAVEDGLSVVWLGVITAVFAILPIVLAVRIGRYIDRGHDAKTGWYGSALLVAACAGYAWSSSLVTLLLFTSLLGIAHLMLVICQQVLCTRHTSGAAAMDRMLGNYMVANAVGQGTGSYIVGWAGGSASIPPTHMLFTIGLCTAVLTMLTAFMLPPGPQARERGLASKPVPVRDILTMPGLSMILFVSVVTVAAQDLIVVYMPLLGSERGMAVDVVGTLLAARSIASMASRFLFARLNQALGRRRVMIVSVFASAVTYTAIALPLPLPAMYLVLASAGFSLGIAVTASIAGLLGLAGDDARGTANSLRMMGNRIGQFTIPFMASLIAAAAGAAGIFVVIGLSLAVSATAVRLSERRP